MNLKLAAAAVFASLLPLASQADDRRHKHDHVSYQTVRYVPDAHERAKIDQRQQEQRERIIRASRKGDLTRAETERLLREQREIHEQERRYLADGHLSRTERAALHAELNQASRHIHHEAHDSQQRR
jgi:hypothetical protein